MAVSGDLQAIILSGGKGERLRPFTDDRPKPMVLILDKPILEYQVRWLASQGVKRIVFSCGYRYEVIQRYFEDGQKFGVEIRYAVEDEPLGRGGGIKLAWNHLEPSDSPVIATNGDVMTSFDLAPMIEAHRQAGAMATILLVPFVSQYGIVDLDGDPAPGLSDPAGAPGAGHAASPGGAQAARVVGFRSEPVLPYWVNGGVYVLDPAIRDLLPDKGDHEEHTFPRLAKEGKLLGYKSQNFWRAVDTVKDLTVVRDHLSQRLMNSFLRGSSA
jgi:NDP-sugar pyrophosphorylase family protein